jgi:uncharacterized membrane protein YgcG
MARRLLSSLIALVITLPVIVFGAGSSATAAGDGLSYRSTTTYTLDAAAGVVHVLVDISMTNTIPDKREGNYISRRYFTGFALPAPVGAANTVATTGNGRGLGLTARFIDGNSNFYLLDIDFASNLFYQQTANVRVTYDITGFPPRSDNPSRVNGAYAAFDAFGIGDEGKVTVRVVVPPGFTVDAFGDDAVVTQEGANTVYTATDIPNPDEFDIFISARNDDGLLATPVETAAGDQFNLRSWPGDAEWQTFVTTQITDGVPVLSELIGQDWPIDEEVEVREAYTPYLYGYAGWFSATRNEIEIGEDLDQEVVLHELSHAWFNDAWFVDRWLSEGFAQVYSNKAVEELGGDPLKPHVIRDGDSGQVSLNEWGDPNFTDGADEVEDYGYNAAFYVVKEITDQVGDEQMRTVFEAVANSTNPYVGEGPAEDIGGVTDWRRFLDLVQELGGADDAQELFEQYVVTDAQKDVLDDRATAREAYAALLEHGGEWAAPLIVRRAMASWGFERANTKMEEAEQVLALRDELDDKTAELASSYPDTYETSYQDAEATDDLGPVGDAVQEQIDTADAVLAAVAADAEDDGLFDKLGLLGTNLPALLTDAKAAYAKGDHDTARDLAQQVIDTVRKAPDVGKSRAMWIGGGIALFLLLLILLIVLLRRRKRRRLAAVAAAEAEREAEAAAAAAATVAIDPITGLPVSPPWPLDAPQGEVPAEHDGTPGDPAEHCEPGEGVAPTDPAVEVACEPTIVPVDTSNSSPSVAADWSDSSNESGSSDSGSNDSGSSDSGSSDFGGGDSGGSDAGGSTVSD